MKAEIDNAINICIDAINKHDSNHKEQDVHVLKLLNDIANVPYNGRALGIGAFSYKGYRSSWQSISKRFEGQEHIGHSLDWESAVLLLYDFADYNEDEILSSANNMTNNIIYNHIVEHVITNLVLKKDIAKAVSCIPNFRKTKIFKEEDNLDKGYLVILTHYALDGDSEAFFKYFKLCKPSKNRYEINEAKQLLVAAFANVNGVEAAINLCKHKSLGTKYHSDALTIYAEQGQYQELKKVFDNYPELKQPEIETELSILTLAYEKAKINNGEIDDDFEILFERATKVDRKLRWGDCKLQDAMFLNLGLANINDAGRVKRCRKAIKNNSLKNELTVKN